MNPKRLLSTAVAALALSFTLACGSGEADEQPDILGIWGRQTDDGWWIVREFYQEADYIAMGDGSNDNWVYADGEEPLLYNSGAYVVTDEADFGDEVADDVLTVYVLHDSGTVEFDAGAGRLSTVVDRVLHVDEHTLTLQGVYDNGPVDFEKFEELP